MRHKIIVLNRWSDEFASFSDFIDHDIHEVRYITNQVGSQIPGVAKSNITIVNDLTCKQEVLSAAQAWVDALNGVSRVITFSEYDLSMAGFLRTHFNVEGTKEEETIFFRDKVAMKSKIAAANLNVPLYEEVNSIEDVSRVAANVGFPLIVKPRRGAASLGIYKLENLNDLKNLASLNLDDYECEQFIDGKIYHIDGAVKDNKILFSIVSKYINTCLDFAHGKPLGNVRIQDHALKSQLQEFTAGVVKALTLVRGIFHLEVIINDKTNEVYFLEIGARCAGGETPFVFKEIHNLNLVEIACKLEVDENFEFTPPLSLDSQICGSLAIPAPRVRPCRVTKVTSLKEQIKNLYQEITPEIGYVFAGDGFSYEDVSGRFRYVGASTVEVENAIEQTIKLFRIESEPFLAETKLAHE